MIICVDGLDATGKSTQCELIKDYFGKRAKLIKFPSPYKDSSFLVHKYLDGEFGDDPKQINPYAVSSFYAMDRYISYQREWKKYLEDGYILILDRYTTSNLIFQSTKVDDQNLKGFVDWIINYEYVLLGLPRPDITIFLDLIPELTKKLLMIRNKKIDIHEADDELIVKAYENSHKIADMLGWIKVKCYEGKMVRKIINILDEILGIINF